MNTIVFRDETEMGTRLSYNGTRRAVLLAARRDIYVTPDLPRPVPGRHRLGERPGTCPVRLGGRLSRWRAGTHRERIEREHWQPDGGGERGRIPQRLDC